MTIITTHPEVRDFCGSCRTLLETSKMRRFEGVRYCVPCYAESSAESAELFSHPWSLDPDRTTRHFASRSVKPGEYR